LQDKKKFKLCGQFAIPKKVRIVRYEFKIASYKVQILRYKLAITSYKDRGARYLQL